MSGWYLPLFQAKHGATLLAAVLLATKNQLTGGDPDILSDWRPGSSMCDDYWEGIYCYESGPEQGAVQEM